MVDKGGHREVAISGSFAMNRFNFIVLPLPRNLSFSSLHISLLCFWKGGGNFLIFQLRATVRMRNLGTHSFMA